MKRNKKGQFIKGEPKDEEHKRFMSKAMDGNQNAKKLTTLELCEEAYRQYCAHIAKGWSKEAWYFDHPEITLTSKTMEKYISENPVVFPIIHKEMAEAQSLAHWERLGYEMMTKKGVKSEPALYQMFMRNKFKWDKESKHTFSFEPEARTLLKKWEEEE